MSVANACLDQFGKDTTEAAKLLLLAATCLGI